MDKAIIKFVYNAQRDGYLSHITDAVFGINSIQWVKKSADTETIPDRFVTPLGFADAQEQIIEIAKCSPDKKGLGVYMSKATQFFYFFSTEGGKSFATYGSRFMFGDTDTREGNEDVVFSDGTQIKEGNFYYSNYEAFNNPTGHVNHSTITEDDYPAIYSDGVLKIKSKRRSDFQLPVTGSIKISLRSVPLGFLWVDDGLMTDLHKTLLAQNIRTAITELGAETMPPLILNNFLF